MKATSFDYAVPRTVADASAMLGTANASTAAIAGGQSLLPMLNLRVAQPDIVVDLSRLEQLREISVTNGLIQVGALTTHASIEDGLFVDEFNGLLQKVASKISYRAIRHFGTIGGSVALADPAADWPGCLLALNATVRISGCKGTRTEPIHTFVRGQYETSLAADEVIVSFDVPRLAASFRWGLHKVVRKSGAFADSLAFAVSQGRGGPVSVVLAAAGPRPYVLPKVIEMISAGQTCESALGAAIAEDVAPLLPQGDEYLMRLHTSTVLRAIREMQRK
jgi:aerobic carbon-monoxide dehydrogenase medium subunit